MRKIYVYAASLFLTGGLVAPMAITAAAAAQEVQVKIYDKGHKDYHNWDDHEQAAWVRYQQERHWKEHEFAKAKHQEQEQYWEWRHSHPD